MSKLDPTLFNHIVDFLVPHMRTEGQRNSLITPTFSSYDSLYSKINWSGNGQEFTVRLVELFNKHGEVEVGQQALALLLQGLRPEMGIGDKRTIDLLYELLKTHQASPAKPHRSSYPSMNPMRTSPNQQSKWFSRITSPLLLLVIAALVIALFGLYFLFFPDAPSATPSFTEISTKLPTTSESHIIDTSIPTSVSSSLSNATLDSSSNKPSSSSVIQGIWDFDLSSYKKIGSDGFVKNSTSKAKYAIELMMTDALVTGKILGTSGVCDDASIRGTRAEHRVEFIMTYTGKCCNGGQSSFIAGYDSVNNTLSGTVEPVGIPESGCELWYANFDALLRDPFPSLSEYTIEKKVSLAPSNFKNGIWDIDITASETLGPNAMVQSISEFREYVMNLELTGAVLTGKLTGATGGLCSEADIEGFIDGETIRFILTHTGSCCTSGRTVFSGTLESDGTIFTALAEPADIPISNCNLWFANIVGTKR